MSEKLFKKVNSSDYITYKKQSTISREHVKSNTSESFNPLKLDGYKYNNKFNFIPTAGVADASNCLVYSKNYELLQDYKNGVNYIKKICE
jgi:hypothetical protein